MLLKKITLDNYGLYNGNISFDLYPREKYGKLRPVILFGGNNGAGKTTLFDAFRIVLYGKSALGDKVAEADYKAFLKSRIHRSPKGVIQPQVASISLEFEHTSLSETNSYVVTRHWMRGNGKGVVERLSISKNGVFLENVNPDYWQGFIEEIIPERLSSLYFFDGEKIKSIADDANGNFALADSIKTLLGLDIVDRLCSDLNLYKSREALKYSSKQQTKDIKDIEDLISALKEQIIYVREELASNKTEQEGIQNEISALELKLKREGHVFALERDKLKETKTQVESSIVGIRKSIEDECEGLYPFSLCPTVTAELACQLENDQKFRKASIVHDELLNMRNLVFDKILSKDDNNSYISFTSIQDCFDSRLSALNSELSLGQQYGFSDNTTAQIIHWIDIANNHSRLRVGELLDNQELLTRQLQEIEKELLKVPVDELLQPIVAKLSEYNQRLGMAQQKRKTQEDELRSLEYRLGVEQRNLDKILQENKLKDDERNRVELADRIQIAMKDYSEKLTMEKISQLRTTVAERFNCLSRKGDLIRNIEIDPVTFAVSLADRYGNILPKEDLSAGEKQMYAVAMLWGLSITSGRILPIIIDTPLGRLDSEHRSKLVNNYFPYAANQIIILSTDTEIDKQWYSELSSNVSHSYHLSYDAGENKTIVSNEYFWRT